MESDESADDVRRLMALHLATGMGFAKARVFLSKKSPELCRRILRASREQKRQSGRWLHDPIEDEAEFRERIEAAKASAEEESRALVAMENQSLIEGGLGLMAKQWPRGSCHLIWRLTKERLQAQGILWHSPAEMNPCSVFD